jgi:hypothetical protein
VDAAGYEVEVAGLGFGAEGEFGGEPDVLEFDDAFADPVRVGGVGEGCGAEESVSGSFG